MKVKKQIEFRRYDLSGNEPILLMDVDTWKKCYPEGSRILHFHNLMEIGFCHEGDGKLVIGEKEYSFDKNMISIIPANMAHGTFSDTDQFGHWHYIFFDVMSIVSEFWGDNQVYTYDFIEKINQEGYFFNINEHPILTDTINVIIHEYENKQKFYNDSIKGLLRSLVLQIYRLNEKDINGTGNLSNNGQIIKMAINYIGEHYSEPIKIQMIANECGLSEPHFRRIFKKIMNMSALEYVNYIRIQKACELLCTTDKSMTEISDTVGYESISTFNRNFGKIVGFSPYQWKKNPSNHTSKLLEFKISSLKGW